MPLLLGRPPLPPGWPPLISPTSEHKRPQCSDLLSLSTLSSSMSMSGLGAPAAIHPRSLPRLTLPMRPTVLSQRVRAASPALPCQFSPAHLLTAPVCLLFRSRHAVISVSHPTRQQNLALPPDVSGICLLPTLPAGATRSPPACTGFLKGFA